MSSGDNIINKINDKLETMSNGKKFLVILLGLAILGSLFYFTTVDKITVVSYTLNGIVMCNETYINGNLNSTPCPQNKEYYPKEQTWNVPESVYKN